MQKNTNQHLFTHHMQGGLFHLALHERMPVILSTNAVDLWLERRVQDKEVLIDLIQSYPGLDLEWHCRVRFRW